MTALDAAPANARQGASYQWLNRYPKAVDWQMKLTPAPLYELLDQTAGKVRRPALHQLPGQGADLR